MKKRLVILGSGESGTGAALLGQYLGYDVFVSDKGPIKDAYKTELNQSGIKWEENQHTLDQILNAQEIIKSPGIPEKSEVMKADPSTTELWEIINDELWHEEAAVISAALTPNPFPACERGWPTGRVRVSFGVKPSGKGKGSTQRLVV